MEALLEPLKFIFDERSDRFVLCSMAAGLSIARIQEMAGEDFPVIRIMPNTPASVGEGMIQYCSSNVTAEEEQEFCRLMAKAGRLDPVPESLMDAASCVSGCGPAWVYQFIEALADGGVACGLPRAKAQEYAAQTLLGSARLVLESGMHPGALKDAVCSPGGSTIQGVRVLEEKGLRGAVMDAVIAAYNKTKEMGKGSYYYAHRCESGYFHPRLPHGAAEHPPCGGAGEGAERFEKRGASGDPGVLRCHRHGCG